MLFDRRFMLKTLGAVFTTPLAVLKYTSAEGCEILQPVTDIVPVKQDDASAFVGGMSDGRLMRVRLDGLGHHFHFDGYATEVSINHSRDTTDYEFASGQRGSLAGKWGTEVCLTLQSSGQVMCSSE